VAAALLLVAGLTTAPALAAGGGGGLLVRTDDGRLQGKNAEGIDQFLGVPYAAPPVGALRWQAPQPVQPWTGVRSATAYGNRCPQLPSGNGPREDTEDCLFLNVFTPRGYHPARGRGGLPVLFMIHGGGLTTGAGDQHDGSLIVNTDHIVVVSINYEAALRWVHDNIAAFGGDPGRVTIAGESAGGWSVCALMTSPPARGRFSGAIMESGSCASRTPAQAQSAGLAFAAQAGCPDAAYRRRVPAGPARGDAEHRQRQLLGRVHVGRT
jgi:para-nitrobenzyl esterase